VVVGSDLPRGFRWWGKGQLSGAGIAKASGEGCGLAQTSKEKMLSAKTVYLRQCHEIDSASLGRIASYCQLQLLE
jgi:hypothetical protein